MHFFSRVGRFDWLAEGEIRLSDNGKRQVRGTGRLIKELNRSRILECFLGGRALSRVEVAERTGISLPAVSQIVAELEAEQVVLRTGKGESRGGRRPVMYVYNASHAYVVGLDVGGTKIAGGVADLEGNLIYTSRISTHQDGGDGDTPPPQSLSDRILHFISHLLEEADVNPAKVMGIGIGVPGIPDGSGRNIELAPGLLPGGTPHDTLDLAGPLEAALGRPVFVDNDVNMIVRGERWKGALQGVRDGVCITIGTGIGVGLLLDGEVYRGANGAAGEIGYWLIGALGPVHRSEGYGPLETFAAGPGIGRRFRQRLDEAGRLSSDVAVTARDAAEAAAAGDALALEVWRETADVLGIALANLAALLNPETVVVGGGVARTPERFFLEPIRDIVNTLAPYPPQVVSWALGERAGIYGAVSMVVHSQRSSISYLSS